MAIYMVAAIVFLAALAGTGWKAYGLGADHIRAEFAQAQEDARKAAESQRQADQQAARKAASTLQAALTRQKALSRDLGDSLAKHIAALPAPPPGCPEPRLTDGLRDTINRALAGGAGAAGTVVPSGSKPAADADRLELPGANPPAGGGR